MTTSDALTVRFAQCSDRFYDTIYIGRHTQRTHRATIVTGAAKSIVDRENENMNMDVDETGEVAWEENVAADAANDSFAFFETFKDTSSVLFAEKSELNPSESTLGIQAHAVLLLCCKQQ